MNWDIALIALVDEEIRKPFDWVKANCAHLMATSVIACYGRQHAVLRRFRGLSSKRKVLEALSSGGGLDAILSEYFEFVPTFMMAQTGDIGIVAQPDGTQAGGIVLDGAFVARAVEAPVVRVPLRMATRLYRV